MAPWAVVLVVLAAIGLIVLLVKLASALAERERLRLEGLQRWAAANAFGFSREDPFGLDGRFNGVGDIGRGHGRYAFEVLWRSEPVPAFLFQYHFKTWETRTVTYRDSQGRTRTRTERYEKTHWRRYLLLEIGCAFPSFAIRPEGWFDKLAGFIGFDDIDFESEQFSARYHVKCADRQFAYALIHPQVMEWLMHQNLSLQLDHGLLLMHLGGQRHDAADCHVRWSQAVGFINRIPPFVWQDYGHRAPLVIPEPSPPLEAIPAPGDKAGQIPMMSRHE